MYRICLIPLGTMITKRIKATVMYDGTNYAGWQVQPNLVTIQSSLEAATQKLCGVDVRVFGSGRTDAGVHAKGQVFHVDIPDRFNEKKFTKGLNSYLPSDIRVSQAVSISHSFDARFSAKRKEYRYFISNGDIADPSKRLYSTHVPDKLDVDRMERSAQVLKGEFDFASFASSRGKLECSTVREIFKIGVRQKGPDICISVQGSGFLYKMVRSIAGHLVDVGHGKYSAIDTREILAPKKTKSLSRNRRTARALFVESEL